MKGITREVIIDLLPAYFSEECSVQTRQLIEDYFEEEPEFAQMARTMHEKLLQTVPAQLPENHQMQTLRRTQKTVMWRVIGLAIVLASLIAIGLIWMAFVTMQ